MINVSMSMPASSTGSIGKVFHGVIHSLTIAQLQCTATVQAFTDEYIHKVSTPVQQPCGLYDSLQPIPATHICTCVAADLCTP